jgi:hypothetical protein
MAVMFEFVVLPNALKACAPAGGVTVFCFTGNNKPYLFATAFLKFG